jgi:hypothetical protein
MPALGAHNSCQNYQCYDVESVCVDAETFEILVKNDGRADSGEPEHQTKGTDVE